MPKIVKGKGGAVTIWGLFQNPVSKEYIDPESLEFSVRAPDGTSSTFVYGTDDEVIRDTIGNYYYTLTLGQEGTYHWKWFASTNFPNAVVVSGDLDSVQSVDF